jgi:hypothetical protein
MERKIVRITKDFRRAVQIGDVTHVLTFGVCGMTLRRLGAKQRTAVPVTWLELSREGGLLDEAELDSRPLLALCGANHGQALGTGGGDRRRVSQ